MQATHSSAKFAQFVVLSVALGLFIVILLPPRHNIREYARRMSCRSNLREIRLSMVQYIQDYDDHYPRVTQGKDGWADVLQPYAKSWQIFQCPSNGIPSIPTRLWRSVFGPPLPLPRSTDYWYNARLSMIGETSLKSPATLILMGEGPNDQRSNYAISQFPAEWVKNQNSSGKRHLDGMNLAFIDGHVKWYRLEKLALLHRYGLKFTLESSGKRN